MTQKQSNIIYLEDYPDLKVAGHTSTSHTIYYCPMCEKLRGKPDTKGKLYYNVHKRIGMCFRCGTILKSGRTMNKEEIRDYLDYKHEQIELVHEPQILGIENFKLIEKDDNAYKYLQKRGLSEDTIKKFRLRECTYPIHGIVFTNLTELNIAYNSNFTDFIQIRDYETTDHSKRFLNPKGLTKPLIYSEIANDSMILCEGFMSGLSAYEYLHKAGLDFTPLISMGKSLSSYQLKQLKEHCDKYEEVELVICYDGGFNDEALKVVKAVYEVLDNCKVRILRLPNDKDPNDLSYEEFIRCWNDRMFTVTPNMINLVKRKLEGLQ